MYLDYFGLNEIPFSITPDPAFVYLSQRHRDALAHLLYGVGQGGSGGFVQLTGEVGTGKTTLCRCLLEQVPDGAHIALILNPLMTPAELLAAICHELGVDQKGAKNSNKVLIDRLNEYLLQAHANGERVVVVIDEAQNLSPESLEQVRLLTNLETSKQKLLQIVLLGQPELRDLLQRRSLRQLAQRITARYHLTPLGPEDAASYVSHRMAVAGAQRNPFRRSALKALYQRSQGIPRLINIIADRALVAAFAREQQVIDARLVHAAADEVQLGEPGTRRRWPWWMAAMAGALLAALVWWALRPDTAIPPAATLADKVAASDPLVADNRGVAGTTTATQQPKLANGPTQAANPDLMVTEPAASAQLQSVPEPAASPGEAAARVPDAVMDADWLRIQGATAWQGLAALWSEPEAAGRIEAACLQAATNGWACLKQQGNFARIRQLGLPVLLELQGTQAGLLLIQGLNSGQVLAGTPASERGLSRAAVEEYWLGQFYVAWPQVSQWPREIARGDQGPAVATVLDMAQLDEQAYQGPAGFGVEFEAWLTGFQRRNGLQADGIIGPQTLVYLMRPSIEKPRLLSAWGAKN